jgi:hypothetical protein
LGHLQVGRHAEIERPRRHYCPAPVTTPSDGIATLMASALVISGAMRAFKLAF